MFKTVFFVAFVAAVVAADFCDKTRPGDNVIKLFATVIYKGAQWASVFFQDKAVTA